MFDCAVSENVKNHSLSNLNEFYVTFEGKMAKLRTILRHYVLTTLVLSSGLAVVRAANDYDENSDDEPVGTCL